MYSPPPHGPPPTPLPLPNRRPWPPPPPMPSTPPPMPLLPSLPPPITSEVPRKGFGKELVGPGWGVPEYINIHFYFVCAITIVLFACSLVI